VDTANQLIPKGNGLLAIGAEAEGKPCEAEALFLGNREPG